MTKIDCTGFLKFHLSLVVVYKLFILIVLKTMVKKLYTCFWYHLFLTFKKYIAQIIISCLYTCASCGLKKFIFILFMRCLMYFQKLYSNLIFK